MSDTNNSVQIQQISSQEGTTNIDPYLRQVNRVVIFYAKTVMLELAQK